MTTLEEVVQAAVVGPDEVLVLAMKNASPATLDAGREIAKQRGLEGRIIFVAGEVQMAVVSKAEE